MYSSTAKKIMHFEIGTKRTVPDVLGSRCQISPSSSNDEEGAVNVMTGRRALLVCDDVELSGDRTTGKGFPE